MMRKIVKIIASVVIVVALGLNTGVTAQAKKLYGDSLKLNNELKLNATKTYTKNAEYSEVGDMGLFPITKNVKAKYTVKSSRKSVGDKYKAKFEVTFKFNKNPKIANKYGVDPVWSMMTVVPLAEFSVFDYSTGKSLEVSNNKGVKVNEGMGWKNTYYAKQRFTDSDGNDGYIENPKIQKVTFTVTYPKKYKNVVVGIGLINTSQVNYYLDYDEYWEGNAKYGDRYAFTLGKKQISYIRLK